MSLPNYVVNLEEMAEAIRNAYQSEDMFNLGKQRVYGLELEVDNTSKQTVEWIVPMDIHVVGIKYGVNDCRNIGYEDTFDMYIDDEKVFEDVHIKEMYEYKRFRQHRPVAKNSSISFEFTNRDKMKKHIWFDIHYADKNIQARLITIVCVDKWTGKEIQRNEVLVTVPFHQKIYAPVLDRYTVVGTDSYDVNIPVYSTGSPTLIFEYELSIIDVTVICIHRKDGTELKRSNYTLKIPIDKEIKAPNIAGYSVYGKDKEHIIMDSSNAQDVSITFEYDITPRTINIICIDKHTGAVIKRDSMIEIPPIDMVVNAPTITHYTLVSNSSVNVRMDIDNSKDVDVIFEYEVKEIKITLICINIENGNEIYRTFVTRRPPIDEEIPAPSVAGYTVYGNNRKLVQMSVADSRDIELTFNYEPASIPDPTIPHDYDWKFVLRWEGNCGTDLDLHGEFSDGTEIYYADKEVGSENNKAWLDYDYTSHNGANDREDKPEIITVLGAISDTIMISVVPYSNEDELTEDATLEIYKLENNLVTPINVVTVPCNKLRNGHTVKVCKVNLTNDNITLL